ncbi:hypothetical protein HY631_03890 [Candidatus Uhrbacteria bacterium]|nr:hypothetical protein [Candidatus Uhrbacteria bacterium]
MPHASKPAVHTAEVSIRDQLEGVQSRREIKPDLALAREKDIAIVQMPSGMHIPAAVGLRTTVTDQTPSLSRITDHWHVTISPYDTALLRRLYAQRHPRDAIGNVVIGVFDAPMPQALEARYDAVEAIRNAHKSLSVLAPPKGTTLEITFAFTRDLVRVYSYRASSTELLRKLVAQIAHHNAREREKYEAAHWPLKGPLHVFGSRLYPWWAVPPLDLWDVPAVPEVDPWEPGGAHENKLVDVVVLEFLPIMESLWKAAFAQDGERGTEGKIAAQLRREGYLLDRLETTRVGVGALRDLVRANRHPGNLTQLGSPDLLEELGSDYVQRLTRH